MSNEELLRQINILKSDLADLRFIISRKTGLGSADIKGNIVSSPGGGGVVPDDSIKEAMLQSNVISQVKMKDNSVGVAELITDAVETLKIKNLNVTEGKLSANAVSQAKLKYETADITVSAGNPTGTATITSGSIVIGFYPTGNNDQFVDNISISGTTLTITLAANATVNNTFKVILLKL